jgi:hypothetical protein
VEDGAGIVKWMSGVPRSPDEEMTRGEDDANVSAGTTFEEIFGATVLTEK